MSFFILCYFIFSLMNALVYVDIDQGIFNSHPRKKVGNFCSRVVGGFGPPHMTRHEYFICFEYTMYVQRKRILIPNCFFHSRVFLALQKFYVLCYAKKHENMELGDWETHCVLKSVKKRCNFGNVAQFSSVY